MKELALVQLQVKNSDKFIFQRRDKKASTSPHLLAFFGGEVEQGEHPRDAAVRELTEETSLELDATLLTHVVSLDFPIELSGATQSLKLHLFSLLVRDANFSIHEGRGSEIYTNQEAISRDDLAPTARFLLKHLVN